MGANSEGSSGGNSPSWQSTVIAICMIALVGGIFLVVYLKSGIGDALKAWGAVGTIIGVLTGAIPTYFFQQAAVQTAQANTKDARATAESASANAETERKRADKAQAKFSALAGAADPNVVSQIQAANPDLFAA
jgi:predicted lipid-binding transport protein (Tim44 family)